MSSKRARSGSDEEGEEESGGPMTKKRVAIHIPVLTTVELQEKVFLNLPWKLLYLMAMYQPALRDHRIWKQIFERDMVPDGPVMKHIVEPIFTRFLTKDVPRNQTKLREMGIDPDAFPLNDGLFPRVYLLARFEAKKAAMAANYYYYELLEGDDVYLFRMSPSAFRFSVQHTIVDEADPNESDLKARLLFAPMAEDALQWPEKEFLWRLRSGVEYTFGNIESEHDVISFLRFLDYADLAPFPCINMDDLVRLASYTVTEGDEHSHEAIDLFYLAPFRSSLKIRYRFKAWKGSLRFFSAESGIVGLDCVHLYLNHFGHKIRRWDSTDGCIRALALSAERVIRYEVPGIQKTLKLRSIAERMEAADQAARTRWDIVGVDNMIHYKTQVFQFLLYGKMKSLVRLITGGFDDESKAEAALLLVNRNDAEELERFSQKYPDAEFSRGYRNKIAFLRRTYIDFSRVKQMAELDNVLYTYEVPSAYEGLTPTDRRETIFDTFVGLLS